MLIILQGDGYFLGHPVCQRVILLSFVHMSVTLVELRTWQSKPVFLTKSNFDYFTPAYNSQQYRLKTTALTFGDNLVKSQYMVCGKKSIPRKIFAIFLKIAQNFTNDPTINISLVFGLSLALGTRKGRHFWRMPELYSATVAVGYAGVSTVATVGDL